MHLASTLALAALTGNTLAAAVNRPDSYGGRRPTSTSTKWVTETETMTVTLQRPSATAGGASAAEPTPEPAEPTGESATEEEALPQSEAARGGSYVESSPSSAPSSAPSLDTKRGFAYNDPQEVKALLEKGTKGSWAYNWGSSPDGLDDSSVEYVPMLWGADQDKTSSWETNVKAALSAGSKHILSFNEPDHAEQAKMSPQDAAAAHVKYLNPHGDKARIGSPAVTNSQNANEGTKWLQQFMDACEGQGCQVDFCVAHWYSPADQKDTLFTHLEEVRKICGDKPVWLTEFGLSDGGDEAGFLKAVLKDLDDLEWLERYSYFMVGGKGTLTSGQGQLSAAGEAYFEG